MKRTSTRLLACLLPLLAAATAAAQPGPLPEPPPGPPPPGPAPTPVAPAPAPKPRPRVKPPFKPQPPQLRGMTLPLHSKKPSFDYGPWLRELPELGVNFVCVSVHIYQEHGDSLRPERHPTMTPSDGTIRRVLKEARALGLEIALLPIVLLSKPRGNDWRGNLSPPDLQGRVRSDPRYGAPDWKTWFRGYRAAISHYARLAEEFRVSVFSVGSELSSTEGQVAEWEQVLREVRQRFSGELTYSANWDHYENVKIWPKLDFIGLSAYYELAETKTPSLVELKRAWKRVQLQILRWRREAKLEELPLLFTEVGYPSIDGCASKPWNYTLKNEVDVREQALCYQAFVETWNGRPELAGAIFYEWWGRGGRLDTGYTPRGKPAQHVLSGWFRKPSRQE